MEVEKAIRTRRTHKAFGARELDRAVIEELVELARWAPNHHLTNPWRFRVIGEHTRARLMDLAEAEKSGAALKPQRAPTLIADAAWAHGQAQAACWPTVVVNPRSAAMRERPCLHSGRS
ncbi:MAG: nitroreductase family protein [Solirubrobacterales bacterium]|nr:nitroreductase family protein [Solirubrobacterales bacterium]